MPSIEQTDRGTVAVSELMSIGEGAKLSHKSWWQFRRLLDQNKIESVKLPNGHRAVVRSSLEQYLKGK